MGRIEGLADLDLDLIQSGDPDELAALLALLHPIITMQVENAVEDLARGFHDAPTAVELLHQPSAVHSAIFIVFSNLRSRRLRSDASFFRFVEAISTASVLHELQKRLLGRCGINPVTAFPPGSELDPDPVVGERLNELPARPDDILEDSLEDAGRG